MLKKILSGILGILKAIQITEIINLEIITIIRIVIGVKTLDFKAFTPQGGIVRHKI